jgi:7-cyano-7-deazaguanine synthase
LHINNSKIAILASGGIDSTACIHFYLQNKTNPTAFFIDYNQPSRLKEWNAIKGISEYYKIPLKKYKWSGSDKKGAGLIIGRNAFFLSSVLMEIKYKFDVVALGIHCGTDYVDCTPEFVREMQNIYDIYTGGVINISAPFICWNKADIWKYCLEYKIPIEKTYSCELGLKQPCGKCLSCKDLRKLYAC